MADEPQPAGGEVHRTSGSVFGARWESIDRSLWAGVTENAGHHSLLVDDRTLFATLPSLPLNVPLEPVVLLPGEGDALADAMWLVQRTVLVAQWGIFNPVGPSIGSFEVAVDYVGGRGYVLERLRHPFGPRLTLHAVVDLDGFGHLDRLLGAIVEAWADAPDGVRSLPEWFEVATAQHGVDEALCRALARVAVASEADLAVEAVQAMASVRTPWAKFSAADDHPDDVAELRALDRDVQAEEWLAAVTNAAVVDAHLANLRSAWEGASAFVRDPDSAQAVADRCRRETYRRIDGGA